MTDPNDVLEALAEINDQRGGSYAIVTADAERNLFAQFLADGASGLHAELVGNAYLGTEDQLTLAQQAELRQRGWSGNGETNWSRDWERAASAAERQLIVLESLSALAEVFGANGDVRVDVTLDGVQTNGTADSSSSSRVAIIVAAVGVLIIGIVLALLAMI